MKKGKVVNIVKDKSLRNKAVDIKGKAYVLVSDRVLYFNENYPDGSIVTNLESGPESPRIVIKATVTPDWKQTNRYFTGYSQATVGEGYINKTSALENAETSAVGRALAMMGIGVIDSIASKDEVVKATNEDIEREKNIASWSKTNGTMATTKQKSMIFALAKEKGLSTEAVKVTIKKYFGLESFNLLDKFQAKKAIDNLLKKPSVDSDQIQS